MQIMVEVKQPDGEVREGVSNGKPWKMARQAVAVFLPQADYPVAGQREIYVPKERDGTLGQPEFMRPGRYHVELTVKLDKWGVVIPVIDWRNAKAVMQAVPQQPARQAS